MALSDPAPQTCLTSCFTDPNNAQCSCDIHPCDFYVFVNNIWLNSGTDLAILIIVPNPFLTSLAILFFIAVLNNTLAYLFT